VTDFVTDSYNRRCLEGDRGLLDAMSQASARFPEAFHASCAERLLPRPFFMDEAEILAFSDDLVALFDLLVSLPDRLFDGSLLRYAATLGIDPRRAAVMTRLNGRPTLYGRADLYHDGTSFKLLELNIGSELGGTDRAEISRKLLEVDAFGAFARQHRLGYVHTGEHVAHALRTAAEPLTGGADPVVAFLESDGGLPEYLHLVLSFQEMMRGLGIEVVLGEVSQIESRGGRLYLHGRPIDLVLRYFTATDVVADPDGERVVEPIFRAHEEGRVVLWTTMQSALHTNKGCLALLSDPRWREALSAEEATLVDRVVPWTRTLTEGPVQADGQSVDLLDYCRQQREELIIKPRAGFGGKGIVVGWQTGDAEWKDALETGRDDDYVVQRRVVPRSEPVVDPETVIVEDWIAAWDAFLTPDGYAGSHIRALPRGEGAIVGMGASAKCRTTGVFNYLPESP
jgi:hypothetical protein